MIATGMVLSGPVATTTLAPAEQHTGVREHEPQEHTIGELSQDQSRQAQVWPGAIQRHRTVAAASL